MISVLILTLNEERNIEACLESVAWSDDVVVLDSGSEDRTVELARARGARILRRSFDDFASQRNFGLREGGFTNEWVLHLDADERVTPELRSEMERAAERSEKDAFRVPSKLMFQDRWLKHAGMYPLYQIRFGRRDRLAFTQVGHGQRGDLPADRIGTLEADLLHYAFSKGITDWFERHNRYSTDEARRARRAVRGEIDWAGLVSTEPQRRRRALKELSFRMPFRPFLRFLYMYVGRLGLLDGRPGFDYCVMMAVYEYMTGLKMRVDFGSSDEPAIDSSEEPASVHLETSDDGESIDDRRVLRGSTSS